MPQVIAGQIVRNSTTGAAWMVNSDGYRNWIATGGDYQCFTGQGHAVANLDQVAIDTIPDRVGTHAICTPPQPSPPPASAEPTFTVMNTSETPPDGVWFRNSA